MRALRPHISSSPLAMFLIATACLVGYQVGCQADQAARMRAAHDVDPGLPCGPYEGRPGSGYHKDVLQWTPDGAGVIFTFDEAVWMLEIDDLRMRKIADGNPDLNSDSRGYSEMTYGFYAELSPDGSSIVYSTCQYEEPGIPNDVRADRLALVGERGSLGYEIAMIGFDGARQLRLTKDDWFEHYPAWSPDGTRIAFVASRRNSLFHSTDYDKRLARLYVMDVGGLGVGTPVTRQTIGVALYPPVWSPDGQRLAFIVDEGQGLCCSDKRALYTVRDDGTELHRIGGATTLPTWSPRSDRLAFSNADGEVSAIYTAKPDGTDLRQIWNGELNRPITRISWSPDGTEILVVSGWLWTIRPDGSAGGVLGTSDPPIRLVDAAWSADGSRIAARGRRRLADPFELDEFRILSMARDGSDVRLLAAVDAEVDGGLFAWKPPMPETTVDLSSCSAGRVVPVPEANQGLVQDCKVLLEVRDKLAGSASLNWDAGVPVMEWRGVDVEGSPPRVQGLALRDEGLTGYVPPELGQLTELRFLDLSGRTGPRPNDASTPNELSGVIPRELGSLTKLEVLSLSFNYLSGPVPEAIWNLRGLRILELMGNFLTGCVPEALSHLVDEYTRLETCIATEGRTP